LERKLGPAEPQRLRKWQSHHDGFDPSWDLSGSVPPVRARGSAGCPANATHRETIDSSVRSAHPQPPPRPDGLAEPGRRQLGQAGINLRWTCAQEAPIRPLNPSRVLAERRLPGRAMRCGVGVGQFHRLHETNEIAVRWPRSTEAGVEGLLLSHRGERLGGVVGPG